MSLVPPSEQFLSRYTFTTPATGFRSNFVNIIAEAADVTAGTVLFDAIPLAFGQTGFFQVIGTTGFACAKIPISLGSHNIQGSRPLGIYVYGFDTDDSYGYPGGFSRSVTWSSTLGSPVCRADFDNSGALGVQDMFDFLAAYFSGDPRRLPNASAAIGVQDIFDFLACIPRGAPERQPLSRTSKRCKFNVSDLGTGDSNLHRRGSLLPVLAIVATHGEAI